MARCAACGRGNPGDSRFCGDCGAPVPAGTRPAERNPVLRLLRTVGGEPTGLLAAAFVFALCIVVAIAGWYPLDIPARLIRAVVPDAECGGRAPGSASMFACSAGVGLLQIVGPAVVLFVLFLLRAQIRRLLAHVVRRVPEEVHFLVAPVFATVLFTITWAGFHPATRDETGIVPHWIFPALVGLFTFLVTRYERPLQRLLAPLLAARERVAREALVAAVILVPALLAWVLTHQDRVTSAALKEQLVVVVALVLGWLLLAPRGGGALARSKR